MKPLRLLLFLYFVIFVGGFETHDFLREKLEKLKLDAPFPEMGPDYWSLCGSFIYDGDQEKSSLRIVFITGNF